jgi:hypothetical protein
MKISWGWCRSTKVAEFLLIQLERFHVCAFCFLGTQLSLDRLVRFGKLFHQFRADGKEIAARKLKNLTDISEACAHYFGFVTELFVLHNLPALIQHAHIIARHCFRARAWLHGE